LFAIASLNIIIIIIIIIVKIVHRVQLELFKNVIYKRCSLLDSGILAQL